MLFTWQLQPEKLKVDSNDEGYQLLSDDDIVKQIKEEEDKEDEAKEDVPNSGEVKDTLHVEARWVHTHFIVLIETCTKFRRYANWKQLTFIA